MLSKFSQILHSFHSQICYFCFNLNFELLLLFLFLLPLIDLFISCSLDISENIYDQIPAEPYYDAPYEMQSNEDVYEPPPPPSQTNAAGNVVTINGISLR